MRTLLTILTLIGLQFTTGCKVTNNYYSIYPTKVERVETKQSEWPYGGGISLTPGIDPGFYKPLPNHIDIATIPEEWILITKDTIK